MSMTRKRLAELQFYRDNMEAELDLARHVLGRVIRKAVVGRSLLRKWMLPAETFSGDIVAAGLTAGERLHVILADGTGHGLSAAICMMPVADIFYVMTEKGFPIGAIADELNKKMHRLLPTDRFVAATLVSIDWPERTIEVWNGGSPSPLFIDREGTCIQTWKSTHLPLGVLGEEAFDAKTDLFQWETPGDLFLCSDGLIDGRNAAGAPFGWRRVREILSGAPPATRFDRLKEAVADHLAGKPGEDDISLVAVRCEEAAAPRIPAADAPPRAAVLPGRWTLDLHLGPPEVKAVDILPKLLTWLRQAGVPVAHAQRLFLILSELYNNAVDHGLLGLDSGIKGTPGGFEAYLRQRAARLASLEAGEVRIRLERAALPEGAGVRIRVEDSGPGFDYDRYLHGNVVCLSGPAGRGIALVRALSEKVAYLNRGNEVEVTYLLA